MISPWLTLVALVTLMSTLTSAARRPVVELVPPKEPSSPKHALTEHWFTQTLDHFNPMDSRDWQQRYLMCEEFYKPGGSVFLFLSGEWTADGAVNTYEFIGDLADQNNALVIDLEHRYYGYSRPTPDTSTENLQYLSIDQALEDAASFKSNFPGVPGLNLTDTKWILMGLSYSANLVAWARAKYPHLFYAAYASSAPVLPKHEVTDYFEIVRKAYATADAGCPDLLTQGMEELDMAIAQGEGARLANLFMTCEAEFNTESQDDYKYLVYNIVSVFGGNVQGAKYGTLSRICNSLAEGPVLDKMAAEVRLLLGPVEECLLTNYTEVTAYYRDFLGWDNHVNRKWNYQKCTEFGGFATLRSKNQPFGQRLPLEFFVEMCGATYGPKFTLERIQAGVNHTRLEHGGLTPENTRVLYTHGSLDPWIGLGIKETINPESPVIMIEGAGHIRDLLPQLATDSDALKAARLRVSEIVAAWNQA